MIGLTHVGEAASKSTFQCVKKQVTRERRSWVKITSPGQFFQSFSWWSRHFFCWILSTGLLEWRENLSVFQWPFWKIWLMFKSLKVFILLVCIQSLSYDLLLIFYSGISLIGALQKKMGGVHRPLNMVLDICWNPPSRIASDSLEGGAP